MCATMVLLFLDKENMGDYLFGIKNSNRDFWDKKSWGKNQFNTSFPAALTCYMYARGIKPIYVTIDENLGVVHRSINQEELLGCKSFDGIFFSFEDIYETFSVSSYFKKRD